MLNTCRSFGLLCLNPKNDDHKAALWYSVLIESLPCLVHVKAKIMSFIKGQRML